MKTVLTPPQTPSASPPKRARLRPRSQANAALALGLGVTAWIAACGSSNGGPPASTFTPDGGDDANGGNPPDTGALGKTDTGALGSDADTQPTSLVLTPANATVTVTGNGAVTQNFTLKGKLKGGGLVAINASSVQFDRPDLATVAAQTGTTAPIIATAPSSSALYGGTGTLHVVYQGLTATAKLTVKVAVTSYGKGLSALSASVKALAAGGSGSGDGGTKDSGAKDGSSGGSTLPADPSASILYPYDQTVWPLGLTSPRIMWDAPKTGDVYRVHYEEASYSYDGYFTLASLPAQMPLDQSVWDHLTASNNAKNGADPLAFSLSRYDAAKDKAYLTSSQTWSIAPESLAGAIYYWSASANAQNVRVGRVSRFRPGSGATPEPLYNGECVGCHAVNAQGTVLVGDVDDTASSTPDAGAAPTVPPYTNGFSGTRAWASFDITKPTAPIEKQTTKYGADLALTPDGKYVVFGGAAGDDYGPDAGGLYGLIPGTAPAGSKHISLSDLKGNVITTSGLDDLVLPTPDGGSSPYTPMMPAFSPDGTKLALVVTPTANDSFQDNTLAQVPNPNPGGLTESIAYLTFDESKPSFDPKLNTLFDSNNAAFASLGPGGTPWNGIAYPSFSPDSKAVAFHVGEYATGCNSYDVNSSNPAVSCGDYGRDNGALFIATLADKMPIRLAHADTPPSSADALSAVEPTFNPVVRGGYSWVVFTSLRQFGNQPWPAEVSEVPDGGTPDAGTGNANLINAKRRLWVAAVDTSIGKVDPSHPAIYLEGQDDTPNMRAFWTLSSCIATPGAPSSGGGDAGVDASKGNGKDAGKKGDAGTTECTAGFQCCSGFCENNQCVDASALSCVGVGSTCATGTDCCNPSVVECNSGTCAPMAAH